MVARERLNLHLMDVVIVMTLWKNTFIWRPSERFNFPINESYREDYSIKLNKSLYRLKQ